RGSGDGRPRRAVGPADRRHRRRLGHRGGHRGPAGGRRPRRHRARPPAGPGLPDGAVRPVPARDHRRRRRRAARRPGRPGQRRRPARHLSRRTGPAGQHPRPAPPDRSAAPPPGGRGGRRQRGLGGGGARPGAPGAGGRTAGGGVVRGRAGLVPRPSARRPVGLPLLQAGPDRVDAAGGRRLAPPGRAGGVGQPRRRRHSDPARLPGVDGRRRHRRRHRRGRPPGRPRRHRPGDRLPAVGRGPPGQRRAGRRAPGAAGDRPARPGLAVSRPAIDVLSPAVYLEGPPWEQLAWLRDNAPVYDHVLDDPLLVDRCWVVSRHEDVRLVSRDPATYSSADGIHLRRAATHHFRPNMINLDDPDHARLRKLVSGGFTPRVVRAFERHYAELAAGVLDRALAAGGEFDGVEALAAELPLLAICEILGAPEADRFRIFAWSNTLLSSEDPDYAPSPEAFQAAVMGMVAYAGELADRHRRERGDDLVSALLGPDGELPLTDAEFEGLVMLLLAAGNETTRNAIAHGLLAFAEHPDQWAALRAAALTEAGA